MAPHEGGCMCGEVRYALRSPPFDCGWCHCRTCQLIGSAPAVPFATVPVADFVWTKGEDQVRTVRSSSFGRRSACGLCGTGLTMRVDHQPETVDFTVITLDEPGKIPPEFHIFWEERIGWFDPADGLPRFDKFRPTTRGLEGTEPPHSP
jgi:hypothetical protein